MYKVYNNNFESNGNVAATKVPPARTKVSGNSTSNVSSMTASGIVRENTKEFCRQSTLHGLKYIVDEQLYPIERIFFALSFVIVVLVSAFFITNVYAKWRSTPVIVGTNPVPSYIENNPFPAVTVCNLNQASKSRVAAIRANTQQHTMLQYLCQVDVNMSAVDAVNWSNFEEFILNPCEELLMECKFGEIAYNCSNIFRPIVTDEGLCCVFNMVSPDFIYAISVPKVRNITYNDDATAIDWNPQYGYPRQLPSKFYPRKSLGTGVSIGLTLTLDADIDDYYCSSSRSIGFKTALHSPIEKPHVRENGNLLAPGMETQINIRTDWLEAAPNVRAIDKRYRRCLFEGESKLDYFRYYNRRNCEIECKARQLLQFCGCIAHYMPIVAPNPRICGINQKNCVDDVLHYKLSIIKEESHDCQRVCWPSCFDLKYLTDLVVAPITHAGLTVTQHMLKNISSDYEEKSRAVVHYYFQDNIFRTTKQTEFIAFTDFLSSVGGLMGLFMGFSFISIAELIYYALMRPYHIIKQHTRVVQSATTSTRLPLIASPTPIIMPQVRQRYQGTKLQQFPAQRPLQFGLIPNYAYEQRKHNGIFKSNK